MSIVVGYTPDDLGEAVLASALAESALREQRLVVLNTTRADRLVDPAFAQGEALESLRGRLEEDGHELRHVATEQLAADDLLGVAHDVGATLIVLGVRRRSAVGKLLLGSTAQRVLLGAHCPVLAVPAPD